MYFNVNESHLKPICVVKEYVYTTIRGVRHQWVGSMKEKMLRSIVICQVADMHLKCTVTANDWTLCYIK